ncbi:hypothetical protein [Virgisporangium aurantiacum]|nr:hypothetical protein [Virgisporangium aurantiacum]
MTAEEIATLVGELGDILAVLADAAPAHKAEVCRPSVVTRRGVLELATRHPSSRISRMRAASVANRAAYCFALRSFQATGSRS